MLRSALAVSALVILAAPAAAANYSAKLASPAPGHVIARDMNWSCASGTCQGATDESRPAVLCQALAKQAGRVESFLVDGRAFSDAELAKCNASAKPETSKALAAQ
ncbi:MAG: CC_3452 family protein [Sphingomicrobium sp.]